MRRLLPLLAACAAAIVTAFFVGSHVEHHLSPADRHGLLVTSVVIAVTVSVLVCGPLWRWLSARWPRMNRLLATLICALTAGVAAYFTLTGLHMHLSMFGHREVDVFSAAALAAGAAYALIATRKHEPR